jgi:hypothetical protein
MKNLGKAGLFFVCLPAAAWGPEGHRLVSRIAATQLTQNAQARVKEILGPDSTIVSVSSWADEVRRNRPTTAPWHYVNIPLVKSHIDMARDCVNDTCVVGEILVLRRKLQDPATSADDRREALMFVIHFIGDMHEPLHCLDHEGGNGVRVVFHERPTNLHSLWDSGLLNRMPAEDQLFTELSADCARRAKQLGRGSVQDWANQSHKEARKVAYGPLAKAMGDAPIAIPAVYEAKADVVVKEQIEKAGARLAAYLNAVFQ